MKEKLVLSIMEDGKELISSEKLSPETIIGSLSYLNAKRSIVIKSVIIDE